MRKPYELDLSTLILLPTLALGLAACPSDENISASADSEDETETEGEETTEDSADPTGDPGPSTPTEIDTTDSTSTTSPTTTAPTTLDTDTTVDPSTTTTMDTGETGDTSTGEPPVAELVKVWASGNPAGVASDVLVGLEPALDALAPTLTIETDILSIQSVAINTGNDAAITFDAPGASGGVIIRENLAQNPMNGALGLGDRVITGANTGLTTPKGVEWINATMFAVADTGAAAIYLFHIEDEGDVAPTATIVDLGTSAAVWDVHYVAGTDTLYAAGTNGEVQAYEDFLVDMGAAGPVRTFTPSEAGEPISKNLHGITVTSGGRMYLSDVGDPNDMADGQLFLIDAVADAEGNVDVFEKVTGGMLGNPVDIEVRTTPSERVYVAEKANAALLVFSRLLPINPLTQSQMLAIEAPESVALVGNGTVTFVSRNGPTIDNDAALAVNVPLVGNPTITATFDRLGSVTSIQSVALSTAGDGWIGFDGPAVSGGGGVFQVGGLAGMDSDAVVSAVAARLWGPSTGIVAPKGIALNADANTLIVADFGAGDIKVFDASSTGDTPPVFVVEDLGGEVPWDVAYDEAGDRLYVAGTNGSVAVYDGFLADQGASGPARFIELSYEGGDSVNLHGIAYDAATDTLLVSDVGDTMAADDGVVFVVADASTADGAVEAQAAITGDQTKLGNPVDLAFDGANLYIAEKSNQVVLRYDNVLDLAGVVNEAEAAVIDVVNAESVQLYYSVP